MVTVVTGFNAEGLSQYGRKSLKAFREHWPKDTKLIVYLEEYAHIPEADEVRLAYDIPGMLHFLKTTGGDKRATGREPRQGWKERDKVAGYCFKFDIHKFCKQIFYLWDGARHCDDEQLIWLDGDVLTYDNVTNEFLASLLPQEYNVSYLGREGTHSEIGFMMFRMPDAMDIIGEYVRPLLDGTVFDLKEWHSAFLFDTARAKFDTECYNMTPAGRGHVWFQSKLGSCMDHLKGDRKSRGASKERRNYDGLQQRR